MSDEDWAKAIAMHMTGRPNEPTPMLLNMIATIRGEGYLTGKAGIVPRPPDDAIGSHYV